MIFFWKFVNNFILLQRTIAKKKFGILEAPKMCKNGFACGEGQIFFLFLFRFCFQIN